MVDEGRNMVSKHMALGILNLGCMWDIHVSLINAMFKRGGQRQKKMILPSKTEQCLNIGFELFDKTEFR